MKKKRLAGILSFSIAISIFFAACDKDMKSARKIEGTHKLVSFSVDGADSLIHLNSYYFKCSDYDFFFNYLGDKGDHSFVRWTCHSNGTSFSVEWILSNETLFFDSSYSNNIYGPFIPFGGFPRWNFDKIAKNKFIISREKYGKKYVAAFKKDR